MVNFYTGFIAQENADMDKVIGKLVVFISQAYRKITKFNLYRASGPH